MDIDNYLESISNTSSNSTAPSSHSFQPAINTLAYVASKGKLQLIEMRTLENNIKAKKRSASSHNKQNKMAKQQSSDDQLQRRSLASTKPKKMLQLAIKNTKESLKALETSHLPQPLANVVAGSIIAPRAKRQQHSSTELGNKTSDEKR